MKSSKKKIGKMIEDGRARFIEVPDDPAEKVKVLQGDGQEIGAIELWQAFKL